ncbi:caspase family protein [Methylibium sp.]|uniref:caspase family protein n=1 Tax=Methylibium sp. TaxID=2067992 RepID=UPI003D134CFC
MTRAAVLIGVNRTGGLPVLTDAVNGAKAMEAWALAQGMPRKRVLLFTDEQGPVDIADVRKAVRALVDSGSIEQLIVYFAGHGVNIRYGEYWLLSDAPIDSSAAVNVEGSIVLARRSGIPHVVFISDACRTAAEGLQAQGITGGEIFPNDPVGGPEQAVDIFFGTTLGRPALEVKDPAESSASFKAVYTGALLDAVSGKLPAAVEAAELGGHPLHLVRPRPLKACLLAELPQRLARQGVPATVSQVPDARITSGDEAWLASVEDLPPPPPQPPAATPTRTRGGPPAALAIPPQLQADARLAAVLFAAPHGPGAGEPDRPMPRSRSRGGRTPSGASPALPGPMPFGPMHFETQCGFKVLGAKVAECVSPGVGIDLFPDNRSLVRIDLPGPAANVLLVLADGSGMLLPAVRGFVTALSIEDGELADVAYEPSDNTARWQDFVGQAAELRALRGVVASSARDGVFRLEGDKAAALATRMQYAKQIDPALALYAAYAYHDLQMTERIRHMDLALKGELSMSFFDLGLLSGALGAGAGAPATGHYPMLPMLSQGWALLSAFKLGLPDGLAGIQRELLPSLWTHFNPAGARRLRELMVARRLQ